MHRSKFSLPLLLSYISVASVSASIVTPALPKIESFFMLATGEVEWMISAFLVGYVFGQLMYGPLANRYGRLYALRFGLFLNLLGLVVCMVALSFNTYLMLVLGRFLTGLGCASGLACTFMLIGEWLPAEQRKTAMAYTTLSFALGIGISVMIGGIITEYLDWRWCFAFLTAYGFLMLWGTVCFDETLQHSRPIHLKQIVYDYAKALQSPVLVVFSIVIGSCSSLTYCFATAAPQIAHETLKLSAGEYGYWYALNIIGMLISGFGTKWLLKHISFLSVIALGFSGYFLGLGAMVVMYSMHSISPLYFFLISSLLFICSGFLFSGGSFIASNALEDKASAAAMMSFTNMGFATLSVIVMGYVSSNAWLSFNITLLAISVGVSCLALLVYNFCTLPETN